MRKNKRKFLILFIIILLFFSVIFLSKCNNTESEFGFDQSVVRLPIDIWPGNFWIIIADKKGFFEDEGVNVEIQDVSDEYDESIGYLVDGDLDANIISVFDVIELNQEGANLVVVLYTDSSEGAEGIVAQKGIDSIEDLVGKKVGVDIGTYLDFNLEVALNSSGLTSDDIERVAYDSLDLEDVFASGEIDATSLWEPDLTKLVNRYDGVKIFDTSDVKGISPGVFAMRLDFIENNPEKVQKLINVWKKSTEWINNNLEETIDIVSAIDFEDDPEYFYTKEEISEIMQQDLLMNVEDNILAFSYSPGFESLYGNAQYVIRFLQKHDESDLIVDVEKMFDPRFIYHLSY